MATEKFAGPSPYTLPDTFPDDDYLHKVYLNNVTTNHAVKCDKPPVGVALFGMGHAGIVHLRSLVGNPRVILKYIVDDCTENFENAKKYWKLQNVTFLTSKEVDRVYKDKSVNVVFIATPTRTHEEFVVNALKHDKDVFCEKPIAQNLEAARKCYDTAKAKGRILFTAFNRRFDPAYTVLRNKIREGRVGHVQVLKVTSRDSPVPAISYLSKSGGIFHDSIVHDFDLSCYVLGELPIRVQASAAALIPEIKAIDDFDTVAYLLTFPSGAVVLGDNSRFSTYGYDQRIEVFGNKGMIKIDSERPCPSTESYIGHEGVKLTPIYYSFASRYSLAYQYELAHFLDVIQNGAPQIVTSWQTLAISKIATAAEESARTGKTVDIDWSKDNLPAVLYNN